MLNYFIAPVHRNQEHHSKVLIKVKYRWWSGLTGPDGSRDTYVQKQARENLKKIATPILSHGRTAFWSTSASPPFQPNTEQVATTLIVQSPGFAGVEADVLFAVSSCSSEQFVVPCHRSCRTMQCLGLRNERDRAGQTPPPPQQSTNIL